MPYGYYRRGYFKRRGTRRRFYKRYSRPNRYKNARKIRRLNRKVNYAINKGEWKNITQINIDSATNIGQSGGVVQLIGSGIIRGLETDQRVGRKIDIRKIQIRAVMYSGTAQLIPRVVKVTLYRIRNTGGFPLDTTEMPYQQAFDFYNLNRMMDFGWETVKTKYYTFAPPNGTDSSNNRYGGPGTYHRIIWNYKPPRGKRTVVYGEDSVNGTILDIFHGAYLLQFVVDEDQVGASDIPTIESLSQRVWYQDS